MIDALISLVSSLLARVCVVTVGIRFGMHDTQWPAWGYWMLGAIVSEFVNRVFADRFRTPAGK